MDLSVSKLPGPFPNVPICTFKRGWTFHRRGLTIEVLEGGKHRDWDLHYNVNDGQGKAHPVRVKEKAPRFTRIWIAGGELLEGVRAKKWGDWCHSQKTPSWWLCEEVNSPLIKQLLAEKAMASHSSSLAWKIPWTEEPGRLQSVGSLRVGHDWVTSLSLFPFVHWRSKWQPTPVFLPGESQGQRSLVGCRL